jgi:hypothetical protein
MFVLAIRGLFIVSPIVLASLVLIWVLLRAEARETAEEEQEASEPERTAR